jgi:hypothetical protein
MVPSPPTLKRDIAAEAPAPKVQGRPEEKASSPPTLKRDAAVGALAPRAAFAPRPPPPRPTVADGPAAGKQARPAARPPEPKAAKEADRVITTKDLKKKVPAKPGDVIEVKLPCTMPYTWVWSNSLEGLRPLGHPRRYPIPREGQTLGGSQLWVMRFEVTGRADTQVPLQLIYCRYDRRKTMSEQVASGKVLRPEAFTDLDARPLNEGDLFAAAIAVKR